MEDLLLKDLNGQGHHCLQDHPEDLEDLAKDGLVVAVHKEEADHAYKGKHARIHHFHDQQETDTFPYSDSSLSVDLARCKQLEHTSGIGAHIAPRETLYFWERSPQLYTTLELPLTS